MRYSCLLLLFFLHLQSYSQRDTLSGIVSILNSQTETGHRQFVVNAQILDDLKKAQPTLTNGDGEFQLVFIGVPSKAPVSFQVVKDTLQVVNFTSLSAVLGQREKVRVSMCSPNHLAAYRYKIYRVADSIALMKFDEKVATMQRQIRELKRNEAGNKGTIIKLEDELQNADKERDRIERNALELSAKYAPVDLDDASPIFRQAFQLYKDGYLDSAQYVLKKAELANLVAQLIAERKKIKELRKELDQRDSIANMKASDIVDLINFKAEMHFLAREFDSARSSYRLLLDLDPDNANYLWVYSNYLNIINQSDSAKKYLEQALKLAPDGEEKINILLSLGAIYTDYYDFPKAKELYRQALGILSSGLIKDQGTIDKYESILDHSLGTNYLWTEELDSSDALLKAGLSALKRLARNNPDIYQLEIINVLNNLGPLNMKKNRLELSRDYQLEALDSCRVLIKKDRRFMPVMSMTLLNTGITYLAMEDWGKAEVYLKQARDSEMLVRNNNPYAFAAQMGVIQTHLGRLYRAMAAFNEAKAAFRSADSLFMQLIESQPGKYVSRLFDDRGYLGDIYFATSNWDSAKMEFDSAITFRNRYPEIESTTSILNTGPVWTFLARIYSIKGLPDSAESFFFRALHEDSLLLQKKHLIESDWDLGTTFSDLGTLYEIKGNLKMAEKNYLHSIHILDSLHAEKMPNVTLPLFSSQLKIGALFLKTGRFSQAEQYLSAAVSNCDSLRKRNIVPLETWQQAQWFLASAYLGVVSTIPQMTDRIPLQQKALDIYNMLYKGPGKSDQLRQAYAAACSDLAFYLLFTRQFMEAESFASKGLEMDSTLTIINTNLAHALLLQGKVEEARKVYTGLKGKLDNNGKLYTADCLDDLNQLRQYGIISNNDSEIRQLLANGSP